jgi:hypothetical protein
MMIEGQLGTKAYRPTEVLFGRRSTVAEIAEIQKAELGGWKTKSIDPKLCFTQAESGIPIWRDIQRVLSGGLDKLRLRYRFYQKGYGFFPKFFPEQVDFYILKKFRSDAKATAVLEQQQKADTALNAIKQDLISWASSGRHFQRRIDARMGELKPADFGINKDWLSPFAVLQPFQLPKVKVPFKDPLCPGHFAASATSASLDKTTVLTQTRLGPHTLPTA